MQIADLSRKTAPIRGGSVIGGSLFSRGPGWNRPAGFGCRGDLLGVRTGKRGQVSPAARPESDIGAQCLWVCSPALGSAGYPIAERRPVLPLWIVPSARTCPIKLLQPRFCQFRYRDIPPHRERRLSEVV